MTRENDRQKLVRDIARLAETYVWAHAANYDKRETELTEIFADVRTMIESNITAVLDDAGIPTIESEQ